MTTNNVLVIGFGNHARRIYYPIISDLKHIEIIGIVDRTNRKSDIEQYCAAQKIKCKTLFVPDGELSTSLLTEFAQDLKVKSVVISTDPESHVMYAKWAFQNGFNVIMDKPIHAEPNAAHDYSAATLIHKKYVELEKELRKARKKFPNLVCEILAQRRFHPAYKLAKDTINEVYDKTSCPITYYYAFHNDGQWRMPLELKNIDYHGFNMGYGKASHSGYHFYDLLNWFSECYRDDFAIDNILTTAWPNYPENYLEQLTPNVLSKVFQRSIQNDGKIHKKDLKGFGEIDVMSTVHLKSSEKVVTHAQIDLLHSGISARSWHDIEGRGLYKNNGRVRHEQHYISMGPFLSISLTSWQSKPFNSEQVDSKNIYKPGHEFNLDITICRNSKLIGGEEAVTISLDELYKPELQDYSRGHQEDARKAAIKEFFAMQKMGQTNGTSSLELHQLSSKLMSSVYQSLASKKSVNVGISN